MFWFVYDLCLACLNVVWVFGSWLFMDLIVLFGFAVLCFVQFRLKVVGDDSFIVLIFEWLCGEF